MKFVELDAKAFKTKVMSHKDNFLLDVREEYEYEDLNIGGQNIPMGEVLSNLEVLKSKEDIYLICASGKRSKAVAYHLAKALGNCNIYSCIGGIQAFTSLR
jgi:rhodanese-related sulfurtransferase